MAEIRKFAPPDSAGLQKLVREALGETTRPVPPGEAAPPAEAAEVPEPKKVKKPKDLGSAAAQLQTRLDWPGKNTGGGGSW